MNAEKTEQHFNLLCGSIDTFLADRDQVGHNKYIYIYCIYKNKNIQWSTLPTELKGMMGIGPGWKCSLHVEYVMISI